MFRMLLVCYSYVTRMYSCGVLVMIQNGQLNYGVVTSLPKSNSLNETILFPTTTRIQTCGGATKAMGAVLEFQCESTNGY